MESFPPQVFKKNYVVAVAVAAAAAAAGAYLGFPSRKRERHRGPDRRDRDEAEAHPQPGGRVEGVDNVQVGRDGPWPPLLQEEDDGVDVVGLVAPEGGAVDADGGHHVQQASGYL